MDMDIDTEMSLIKKSEKKWAEARLFFEENFMENMFCPKKNGMHFAKSEDEHIFSVVKNFFGEFKNDFIDVHIFENGENYVHILSPSQEAIIAFESTMKKFNISFNFVEIPYGYYVKLYFPHNFNSELDPDRIKKEFTTAYQNLLNKDLLKMTLFSNEYTFEQRQKIYRGMFSVTIPMDILRNIHDLVNLYATPDNVQYLANELEKLLTKLILIDRNKKSMHFLTEFLKDPDAVLLERINQSEQVILYCEIIKRLMLYTDVNDNTLNILKNQLSLVALQAGAYDGKREELIKKIDGSAKLALMDLEKIVKFELTEEIDKKSLEVFSEQFAYALKNIAYHNFLNVLPEDFYHLAWSKNLNDPNSEGQTLKKIIADYNVLSYQTTNDIVHSLSYHHQVNVMSFYVQACTKLIQLGDFNTAHAIYSGLNHVAVSRLNYLKTVPFINAILHDIEKLFSYDSSMKNYRAAIKLAVSDNKIVIPVLGVHLKELTFAEDGNPTLQVDGSLNVEKFELLGGMFGHLDDSLAQLYRAKPLQTCISLSKMKNIVLDEDKVYETSLHAFPREVPDISKCKTINDLAGMVLLKRSLPLYLQFTNHHHHYTIPKAYFKLIEFLEDKVFKKDVSLAEVQTGLLLSNKIKLHAGRNFMLVFDLAKRIDKINSVCFEKIKLSEMSMVNHGDSDPCIERRLKL